MKSSMLHRNKINVVHIRDSSGFFGAEQVIMTIAKNLNKEKFNIYILCLDRQDGKSDKLIEVAKRCDINTLRIPVGKGIDLSGILKIRKILKKEKIHIIHTHDYKSDLYGLIASLGVRIKRVTTSHGSTKDSFFLKLYLAITERCTYRLYHLVHAVSEARKNDLLLNKALAGKIELIENGFDRDLFEMSSSLHSEKLVVEIPANVKVIGIIGRLLPDKGHKYLFKAFSELLLNVPDIYLLVIGDGPSRMKLEQLSNKLKVDKKIKFLGIVNDMKSIYERLDLLVIPSLREGMPCVLLEALSLNVPTIATAVGGIPDIIENNVNGILVAPMSIEQLRNAMYKVLTGKADINKMRKRGYNSILRKHTFKKMLQKVEYSYMRLVKMQTL